MIFNKVVCDLLDYKMSKLLNIFLIFSILISFSFAFDTKNIAYQDFINKEIKEVSVEKGISYIISYEIGDITKNYIKIFIKSDDISKYLYVYYSPITQNREDAYLLNLTLFPNVIKLFAGEVTSII